MRRTRLFKSLQISRISGLLGINTHRLHSLLHCVVIVDTLGTGDDFLAADEAIVGVCVCCIRGVEVGVEGAGGDGVVGHCEEIGGILGAD